VLDARSLLPFDYPLLVESVNKTGRLVVFDDCNRTCGFGAEISAFAAENLFHVLLAPIIRVTRADVPVPFSTALDKHVLPRPEQLQQAIRQSMNYCHKQVFDVALEGGRSI
jgi:acetoin:2,6-dichlorophenolindophenol oxidoreductase subunit beta